MYSLNQKDFGNLLFILKMCDDIKLYQENKKITQLLKERMSLNAILLNLMQIGEYSNKLSKDFLDNFDDNYWQQLIGIRHRITHDYGGIDLAKIEDILREHIDILIDKCLEIFKIFYVKVEYKELIDDITFRENFNSKYLLELIE